MTDTTDRPTMLADVMDEHATERQRERERLQETLVAITAGIERLDQRLAGFAAEVTTRLDSIALRLARVEMGVLEVRDATKQALAEHEQRAHPRREAQPNGRGDG